ncbi:MAG: glycosyltransferase family 1 protein [Patescibacteria group bacterium]
MKIAYFLGTLKKEDGVTRVLLALIREAQARGNETIIITGLAEEDEKTLVVPIITVPAMVFPLYKEYKLPYPGMRGFARKLDEFRPDIIHVHSPDTLAWAAVKYAKKRNIPIVATYHTDFARYLKYYHLSFLRPFIWLIFRRLYNKMRLVSTPSKSVSAELESRGIKNVHTIPWGVDTAKFNPSFRSSEWRRNIISKENNSGREKSIILYAGRITWEKELRSLAATYNLLRESRSDFEMVLAGDGPARRELETLMPGAIFLGHLEGESLSEAFASSDIFLFPSATETFGNVSLEALASGLVPILADAGGSRGLVISGENGLLAAAGKSADFYSKVCLLLDNKKMQSELQINALKSAKNYTWQKVEEKFNELYVEIIRGL